MGNFFGKILKSLGRYGSAVLIGYDISEKSKGQEAKVDVREIHQIVHNIYAMKEAAAEKDASGISGMWLALVIFMAVIFVAIVAGIAIFCCYEVKSETAKKAVENYKREIANK